MKTRTVLAHFCICEFRIDRLANRYLKNNSTPLLTINNWRNCISWSSMDDWLSAGNIHFPPLWLKCSNRTGDVCDGSNCDLPRLRDLRSSAFHPHHSTEDCLVGHDWYPEWRAWTSASVDRSGASSRYLSIIHSFPSTPTSVHHFLLDRLRTVNNRTC